MINEEEKAKMMARHQAVMDQIQSNIDKIKDDVEATVRAEKAIYEGGS